jgi:putative ABC transport system permease protein
MVAMPVQSQLIDLPLTQGRKLLAEDVDAVILNQRALAFFPNTKVGDKIQIRSFGKIKTLQLTGIVQQKMTGATAYISPATLATLATLPSQSELSRNYKIVSAKPKESEPELTALANTIREVLKDHQIPVAAIVTETMLRTEVDGHFNLLILSLLFIALLMASVGALGLSATISNNVVERTREFGIMRSLGASRGTIMQNIIVEACMITAISYLLAIILALPLSVFIGRFVGELLMEEAFPLVVSWQSLAIWWLITTFIGIAASAVPAWHSARLSIRETLVFH